MKGNVGMLTKTEFGFVGTMDTSAVATILAILAIELLWLVLFRKIFRKSGIDLRYSFLSLLPFGSLICALILAIKPWPNRVRLDA